MDSRSMHCCGVKELITLASYYDPFLAMMGVVANWKKGEDHSGFKAAKGTLYSNYIFSAAVYDKEVCDTKAAHTYLKKGELWDTTRQMYFPYGHAFADFIVKNKLGTVSTVPASINKAFHPDHKVQVWVWSPDPVALDAWAKKYNADAFIKLALLPHLIQLTSNYVCYDKYKASGNNTDYHKGYIKTSFTEITTKLETERKKDPTFRLCIPSIPSVGVDFSAFA